MDVVVDGVVAVDGEVGGAAGDAVRGAGVADGAPPGSGAYPRQAQAAVRVASSSPTLLPACHLK